MTYLVLRANMTGMHACTWRRFQAAPLLLESAHWRAVEKLLCGLEEQSPSTPPGPTVVGNQNDSRRPGLRCAVRTKCAGRWQSERNPVSHHFGPKLIEHAAWGEGGVGAHLIWGQALWALPGRAQPGDTAAEGGCLVRVPVACAAVAAAAVAAAVACALPAARAARQRRPHWRPAGAGHGPSHSAMQSAGQADRSRGPRLCEDWCHGCGVAEHSYIIDAQLGDAVIRPPGRNACVLPA